MGSYPCCWCSVRTGTKIIATINAVCGILLVVIGIIIIIQVRSVSNMLHSYLDSQMQRVFYEDDIFDYKLRRYVKKAGRDIDQTVLSILVIATACVMMIFGKALLVLALVLYTGAKKGSVVLCKIWLIVYGSCNFIGALGACILITRQPSREKFVFLIMWLMINSYFIWVVIIYIKKLRKKIAHRLSGGTYALETI